jgi:energy-coupling factor transport system ATP-binding protein
MKLDSTGGNALLELHRVSVVLEGAAGETAVLEDISLRIERGEFVAVVGKNGSGKSSLAKVLAGVLAPVRGNIRFHLAGIAPVQLVLQNPEAQIIGDTVYEDLCFGMEQSGVAPQAMKERAEAALALAGLTVDLHESVHHLSGGQKQLLAVASCLAVDPGIIVFDEATSMLDPLSRQRVLTAAKNFCQNGKAVVWITQMLDELAEATKMIVLDAGRMVFAGSPQQFFYGERQGAENMCDRLRFTPPYTVQVVRELLRRDISFPTLPISPEQLLKEVLTP